jgi:Uncharacterised nucleotidyltransferase
MGGDNDRLRLLGRCLGIDNSSGAHEALRQDLAAVASSEWYLFVKLANRDKITPALWQSLCEKACQHVLPEHLQDYLVEIYQRNARRNTLLRAQACEAVAALNSNGIQPIILKGGLHLFDPRLHISARMMADIDLLVSSSKFDAAVQALRRTGYSVLDTKRERPEYSFTMSRRGALATIDLHRDLGPQAMLLTADEAISAAAPILGEGIDLLSLSPTHQMLHAIINTAVCDPHYRTARISLSRLYELVLLSEGKTDAIDWNMICRKMTSAGLKHAPLVMLSLTRELFNMPVPLPSHANTRARLYVTRYFLQARYRPLMSVGKLWGRLIHTFALARIDYFYSCGRRPWRLTVSRLRHAGLFLRRRDIDVVGTIARDIRGR